MVYELCLFSNYSREEEEGLAVWFSKLREDVEPNGFAGEDQKSPLSRWALKLG